MSELSLLIMRLGFLVLLWLFIFSIVYALRSDLFGAPVRKLPSESAKRQGVVGVPGSPSPAAAPVAAQATMPEGLTHQPPPTSQGAGSSGPARTLVITSGVAAGTQMPLDDNAVTIGRSTDSTLVIVDEYTSTHHARLSRSGEQWMLTDLDSTNGTKLNGSRINGTVLAPVFTPITIGTTTFELRP